MESQKQRRKLKIDENHLVFIDSDTSKESIIECGEAYIVKNFFTNHYPDNGELEKALNYIEYELTDHKELKSNNELLSTDNNLLAEVLDVQETKVVERDDVELAFDKYIDCSNGEPEHMLGIKYSLEKLTTIILVRSVMYYLGFTEIEIVK